MEQPRRQGNGGPEDAWALISQQNQDVLAAATGEDWLVGVVLVPGNFYVELQADGSKLLALR